MNLPAVLLGDERRIRQVLIKLLENAHKFTQRGKIEIKMSYDKIYSSLIVHVKDSGVGIAREDVHRLFSSSG